MRTGKWLLTLALAATAVPQGPAQRPLAVDSVAPRVGLEEVFENPVPWLGREVRATFQLRDRPESWNPYLTRFGTGDYVAARVWSDGQFLWEVDAYESPQGLVFIRRDTPPALLLAGAEIYDRFEARLSLEQVFRGLPWAEVVELEPLPRKVGEGTILHAARALQLMAGESWKLALGDLSRAAVPSLPEHALDEIHRLHAVCEGMLTQRRRRRLIGGRMVR